MKIFRFVILLVASSLMIGCSSSNEEVKLSREFITKISAYEELGEFSEGYAPAKRNGKWGYINVKGDLVIPCQYELVTGFSEGLAAVAISKNEKGWPIFWGYIDKKGELVVPHKYSYADSYSDGLAMVSYNYDYDLEQFYYFIDESGEEKLKMSKDYEVLMPFSEGLACGLIAKGDNAYKVVFFNKEGETVFNLPIAADWYSGDGWDEVSMREDLCFSNGEVKIPMNESGNYRYYVYNKDGEKIRVEENPNTVNDSEAREGEIYTSSTTENGTKYGVKGLTNVDYDDIKTSFDGTPKFNNGVVLVELYEYDDRAFVDGCESEEYSGHKIIHSGYLDKEGNDTYNPELKKRCIKSYKDAEKVLSQSY